MVQHEPPRFKTKCYECHKGKFRKKNNSAKRCRNILEHTGPDFEEHETALKLKKKIAGQAKRAGKKVPTAPAPSTSNKPSPSQQHTPTPIPSPSHQPTPKPILCTPAKKKKTQTLKKANSRKQQKRRCKSSPPPTPNTPESYPSRETPKRKKYNASHYASIRVRANIVELVRNSTDLNSEDIVRHLLTRRFHESSLFTFK